jgi:phage tail sheath gpL-like
MPLAASARMPQVRASIVFGSSGTAPGAAPARVLVIGSRVPTAITATVNTASDASTDYTVAAGLAAYDRATRVTSPDDAATQAGRGSELHLGAVAAFAQYRGAEVWVAPVTPGSGATAASATITPTVSGLAAGTLRVTVMGESVEFGISSSDTVSTIGRKIAQAINEQRDWPVTATNTWSTGAVVVTAKWAGPRGNAITLRLALVASNATTEVTDTTARTAFGLTITLSGGAADGGVYRLASGATDDSLAALLTAIAAQKFERIAFAGYRSGGSTTANLARITTAITAQSDDAMYDQQAVFGSVESPGNSITAAQGNNRERAQYVEHTGGDDLPLVIAAQVATARLFGDGSLGGTIEGEAARPAGNLNDLELATLRAPRDPADLLDPTEAEAALAAGVTPLRLSPTRPGRMALVSSITCRCLSGGVPDYAVYKTKEVTVADYARVYVVADLARTFRGFNLVNDDASGEPPLVARTASPSMVKNRIYGLLKDLERRGVLTEVDARAGEISVTRNVVNPRRLDFTFPTIAPSDFDIADGVIYQRQAA